MRPVVRRAIVVDRTNRGKSRRPTKITVQAESFVPPRSLWLNWLNAERKIQVCRLPDANGTDRGSNGCGISRERVRPGGRVAPTAVVDINVSRTGRPEGTSSPPPPPPRGSGPSVRPTGRPRRERGATQNRTDGRTYAARLYPSPWRRTRARRVGGARADQTAARFNRGRPRLAGPFPKKRRLLRRRIPWRETEPHAAKRLSAKRPVWTRVRRQELKNDGPVWYTAIARVIKPRRIATKRHTDQMLTRTHRNPGGIGEGRGGGLTVERTGIPKSSAIWFGFLAVLKGRRIRSLSGLVSIEISQIQKNKSRDSIIIELKIMSRSNSIRKNFLITCTKSFPRVTVQLLRTLDCCFSLFSTWL